MKETYNTPNEVRHFVVKDLETIGDIYQKCRVMVYMQWCPDYLASPALVRLPYAALGDRFSMRRPESLAHDWSVKHVYAECEHSSPTNSQLVALTLVRLKHNLRHERPSPWRSLLKRWMEGMRVGLWQNVLKCWFRNHSAVLCVLCLG